MENASEEITLRSQPAKKSRKKKWLMILLTLVLVAGGAGAGYWYSDKQAKSEQDKQQAEITALNVKVSDLEKQLAEEKDKNKKEETDKIAPSAEAIANIKAAISSGNTAALEGYMASTVKVILAASEGVGDRTPTEAINDLKYLDSATDPWDFALPAATLNAYKAGFYSQYFPSDAVVGKSANNYVISFTFNNSGKISGIFMTSDANLLN